MENEMRHKIVLMTGGTETLEFFSLQLKKGFEALGYKTFLFDQTTEEERQKNFTILQQLMTRYLSLLTLTVFIMRLHFLT